MTPVSIGCLLLGLSALALCGIGWSRGLLLDTTDSGSKDESGLRTCLALSALSCATASATIYVTFLLLWAYSHHSFNGRQTSGVFLIWVGLLCAGFAFIAGMAARGIVRVFIIVSSALALLLWLLAGAASVAV